MTNSKNVTFAESVLERIKQAYDLETDAALARFLDMKPNTLAMQKKRDSLNWFRIFHKCSDLDKNWLLQQENSQSNYTPVILPLVPQSSIDSHAPSLKDSSEKRNVSLPSFLLSDSLSKHLDQCILVKIDQTSQLMQLNKGDVLLTCTDVNHPLHNKYYLLSYNERIYYSRIHKKSDNQLILLDQEADTQIETINPNTENFILLGRIYWIAKNL